jgi:hypothetical protein
MSAAEIYRLGRKACEQLFDSLVDPARCDRMMAFLLVGYTVIWFQVISKRPGRHCGMLPRAHSGS